MRMWYPGKYIGSRKIDFKYRKIHVKAFTVSVYSLDYGTGLYRGRLLWRLRYQLLQERAFTREITLLAFIGGAGLGDYGISLTLFIFAKLPVRKTRLWLNQKTWNKTARIAQQLSPRITRRLRYPNSVYSVLQPCEKRIYHIRSCKSLRVLTCS